MNSKRVIGSYKTMTAKVGPDDLDYDINRVEFRSHFIQRNFTVYYEFFIKKGESFFDNTGDDGRIKNNYKKKKNYNDKITLLFILYFIFFFTAVVLLARSTHPKTKGGRHGRPKDLATQP